MQQLLASSSSKRLPSAAVREWLARRVRVKEGMLAGLSGVIVRRVDARRWLIEPDGFEDGVYLVVVADALEIVGEIGLQEDCDGGI